MKFVTMDGGERDLMGLISILGSVQEPVWVAISEKDYRSIIGKMPKVFDKVEYMFVARTVEAAQIMMTQYSIRGAGFLEMARDRGITISSHRTTQSALARMEQLGQKKRDPGGAGLK